MVEWAWALLRRQYMVILFCTLLAVSVGVIYLLTAPPKYTAHASLILDGRKGHFFAQQSILTDTPTDVAWVESQVNIVKSVNIAQRVIKNLHLAELPEFAGSDVDTFSRLFGFIRASQRPSRSESELTRQAVEVFDRSLEASRVGTSYVLDVGFTSSDPERAAQIANSVADIYIVDQLDARFEANQRASNWLQDRANGLRDQASTAENAVVAFKQQNGIVAADGKLMSEQQVSDLNAQLLLARGQTAETRARLDRIEAIIRTNPPTTSDATITDALNNPIINKLRQQYLDLVSREAAWSARYGKNHLAVVNLRNQIYQTRDSILQELKRYAQTYRSDYEIASQRQKSLEKDLASAISQSEKTNRARVELNGLESSARNLRTLYNSFLQHYTESVQQQSFPITEARIISRATRPFEKRSPKKSTHLGSGVSWWLRHGCKPWLHTRSDGPCFPHGRAGGENAQCALRCRDPVGK
jgi:succinoglycan biosynthesis transport protein ExoP